MTATLEHVNITVSDPKAAAATLCAIFGWEIRWEGAAIGDGYSVHVGDAGTYLALFRPGGAALEDAKRYTDSAGLNHVGLVVSDLDGIEARVRAAGFETHSHADYEPGRRFYFDGPGGVEFELVSYS